MTEMIKLTPRMTLIPPTPETPLMTETHVVVRCFQDMTKVDRAWVRQGAISIHPELGCFTREVKTREELTSVLAELTASLGPSEYALVLDQLKPEVAGGLSPVDPRITVFVRGSRLEELAQDVQDVTLNIPDLGELERLRQAVMRAAWGETLTPEQQQAISVGFGLLKQLRPTVPERKANLKLF